MQFDLCSLEFSYGLTEKEGFTFAMSIIGLAAKDWRRIMDYSDVGVDNFDLEKIVGSFNSTFNFSSPDSIWGIDQVL